MGFFHLVILKRQFNWDKLSFNPWDCPRHVMTVEYEHFFNRLDFFLVPYVQK